MILHLVVITQLIGPVILLFELILLFHQDHQYNKASRLCSIAIYFNWFVFYCIDYKVRNDLPSFSDIWAIGIKYSAI